MTRLGWYIHHAGRGHITRFLAIRPHLDHEVWVFSSLTAPRDLPPRTRWVQLPSDSDVVESPEGAPRDPAEANPTANGALHWAPVAHPGHAGRLASIVEHSVAHGLDRFVVDVSVEVALLVRLLGIPTIVVAQPGARTDEPHRLAYSLADVILCPWAPGTHDLAPFAAARDRVREVGGISRYGDRADSDRTAASPSRSGGVVLGSLTSPLPAAEQWAALEAEVPHLRWRSVGFVAGTEVDDPWSLLRSAEVVVTAAGQNSVADIAAAGAAAIVIPQERPFDEQRATATVLEKRGLAVVAASWPSGPEWRSLLVAASALEPRWSEWGTSGAAQRAADVVTGVAS
ncbi:glycosyltransferase [Marisediminicola sp. LYQ134]|uniref:glycosyltransferase n=1 Tax=Marisediminicola sp. LYQ134 TaxID=3391061 RepID=UPI003982DC14